MKTDIRNQLLQHKIIVLYALFMLFWIILPVFFPLNELEINVTRAGQAPSFKYIFGCDELGRDLFVLCIHAARLSIMIGMGGAIFSCLLGTVMGIFAGFYGKRVDAVLSRLIDLGLAFPSLLLAMGISVVLPPGKTSIILALMLVSWAEFARLIRGVVIDIKTKDFIQASTLMGTSSLCTIRLHVLPHILPYIWVSFSLKIGAFILAESGLSFLGVGLPPELPTLGSLVASGKDYLVTLPWIPLIPGCVISILVFASNVFGDSMQKHVK